MSATACRSCRQPAVPSAAICLHCGTPNPVTIGKAGNAAALLAGLLVAGVVVVFLFVVL